MEPSSSSSARMRWLRACSGVSGGPEVDRRRAAVVLCRTGDVFIDRVSLTKFLASYCNV
jgi:hypothetical protein